LKILLFALSAKMEQVKIFADKEDWFEAEDSFVNKIED